MNDDLELRLATEEDAGAMLRVLRAAFPRWPKVPITVDPEDHIRWKMASHPVASESSTLFLIDSEVVGVAIQIVREFSVRGERLMGHSTADLAIDPDFQGRGLLSAAAEYGRDGLAELFDFSISTRSNHPKLRAMSAARGEAPRFGNPLSVFIRPHGLRSFVGTHVRSAGAQHAVRTAARVARARVANFRSTSPNLELITLSQFDESVDELWATAAPEFEFIGDRCAGFLNWRHCDIRGGESLVRAVVENGRLLGYGVLRWTEPVATLADLLVVPGRDDVLRALVEDAVAQARARGRGIRCGLPRQHPYVDALLATGFADDGRGAVLNYGALGDWEPHLEFLACEDARVHVMLGDFDYV